MRKLTALSCILLLVCSGNSEEGETDDNVSPSQPDYDVPTSEELDAFQLVVTRGNNVFVKFPSMRSGEDENEKYALVYLISHKLAITGPLQVHSNAF